METLLEILGVMALVFGFVALSAWVFMVLWNFVVPSIFNISALSFWQAFGLVCLLTIIGSMFRN